MPTSPTVTVLVVEDNPDVLDVVCDVLEAAGYRVLTATTAADALTLSAADPGPIDLLLTDLVLPDLRGQALASRLRAARPQIRVLYISGYPSDARTTDREWKLDAPLLMKPFLVAELEEIVREILGPAPPRA